MSTKIKKGDVFLMELAHEKYVYGQIIGKMHGELYVAVYEGAFTANEIKSEKVLELIPFILALTLDAKLWHGDWKIIGNVTDNLNNIPELFFKVETQQGIVVESRDQLRSKTVSVEEANRFRYRKVVAPIRIEKASRAHYGIGEWLSHYDELKADYAIEASSFMS